MDTVTRFSDRVEDYAKYRPGYPSGILDLMRDTLGLRSDHIIADLGSGTGIFSRLLLSNGNLVFGVEPNKEMREMGEALLKDFPRFRSVDGTAEHTTLLEHSVHFVTSAQAFHWFDPLKTRAECLRILQPHGRALFAWNERKSDGSPFLTDYEKLLQTLAADYTQVMRSHGKQDKALTLFFGESGFEKSVFQNHQDFDFAGLQGRLLSSSYAPKEGHPKHQITMAGLRKIFEQHQQDGMVRFEYETTVYFGEIKRQTSDQSP